MKFSEKRINDKKGAEKRKKYALKLVISTSNVQALS